MSLPLQKRVIFLATLFGLSLLLLFAVLWAQRNRMERATEKKADVVNPKSFKQGLTSDLDTTHGKLFYADLEYDTKTNTIVQLETGRTSGDEPALFTTLPTSSSSFLLFKVEVVSNTNELLKSGWKAVAKEIAQTKENTYRFRIGTGYKSGATIRFSLPSGDVIWTGKIP